MSFPCSGCGCCCKRVDKFVGSDFPYSHINGVCEKLVDDKCSVYETRPLICNVYEMQKVMNINKDIFYAMNKAACNMFMDEDNIPLEFRL